MAKTILGNHASVIVPRKERDKIRRIYCGQCWRLVGIEEDLSFYEGLGAGPDVDKVKEGAANRFDD